MTSNARIVMTGAENCRGTRARFLPGGLAACALMVAASTAAQAQWQIVTLGDGATIGAPAVDFAPHGAFSGTSGCNRFQGTARFEDGNLVVVGPVATTRMACPDDDLARQDNAIVALFDGTIAVTFDPLSGMLTLAGGETTIGLVRGLPAGLPLPPTHAGLEPPGGEPPYVNPVGLSDDLQIHSQPDPASEVVGGAFSGQVLRNEGCEGEWCNVAALDLSVSGWAQRQFLDASDSALRAGQGVFDAVGPVPCAQGTGAPMTDCAMGVARDGSGSATVVVTKPDGVKRVLFFTDGAFVSSDTSHAGGGFQSSATREGDLTLIRVDDERYEIPDAVIFGG